MSLLAPSLREDESLSPWAGARPIRILLFLHSFDPGGVERVALRLAGAWAAAGCEVIIAMGRRSGPLVAEKPEGVIFEFAPPFALASHCESLWLVPHLASVVRRRRPDVLFCAGNTYAIVAVLARLLLGPTCPPIVAKVSNCLLRRDLRAPARWIYRRWLHLQTRHIERFIGLSEAMLPEMVRTLKLKFPRVDVVPDPALRLDDIPCSTVARPARRDGGRLFVAVGRLVPQKDFPVLLRAFALGCAAHDRLVILGEGRERGRLARLAHRLGISDQVDLPGHVSQVSDWLARADALVLSSRYEGAPAVVIEALAHGVPVVATDCCASMGQLLGRGAFGEMAAVGDVRALSQAMWRIGERSYDGAAMRRRAAEFTVERAAPRYLTIISDLIAATRRGEAPTGRPAPPCVACRR